ncbi:sensor histidine kinase [Patulibacter americanus]|uniref:sensor histidine kinase n=1 Tax=Patulibacter americanus TaxID=588672 RepID=UPI00040FD0BB|nr:ATP-binding protein [Patulibacter americanus]
MTTGADALAVRGGRAATLRPDDVPQAPERMTILLLVVARVATAVAIGLLAFLADDPDVPLLAALGVVAAVEVAVTSLLVWRSDTPARSPVLRPALVLDLALWLSACAASGGADSPALLIYAVLPSIGALVLDVGWLIACGTLVAAVRLALGGPDADLAVFSIVGVWAVAIAVAASRGRRVFAKRVAGLDAVWTALAGGHGPSEIIRERVADDLRERALRPVVEIRDACADNDDGHSLQGLTGRMSTVIARTRAIAHELHAPAALHGGVEESVRHVAQLRAPAADVVVRLVGDVPDSLAEPLDAVVRDALGIVAGTWTREVVVEIDVEDEEQGVLVGVTATPLLDFDTQRRALRRAALAARAEVGTVDVGSTDDGGARVSLRLRGVTPPEDRTGQVRQFRELGPYVVTVRLGMAPVIAAIALIHGGTEPGFWWVLAALCADLAFFGMYFRRRRTSRVYIAVGVLDYALLAAGFALAGDAQFAYAAVVLLVPITNAAILRWTTILPVTVLAGVVLAVTGDGLPQPAVSIALAWAAVVAYLESTARTRDAERFVAISRRRNELLRGLLHEEEVERRRIAGQLHDDVLQRLFVVRQDLEEAGEEQGGAEECRARRQAVQGLEGVITVLTRTVGDLDVDEGAAAVAGGLHAALATTTALRDGPAVELEIDERAAGVQDGLIVQLARELYANVTRHADAGHMRLTVSRQEDALVLDVVDDGVGFDWGRVHAGMLEGHIGLPTIRARVAQLGGALLLGDAPGGGAHVQIRLPLDTAPQATERPTVTSA